MTPSAFPLPWTHYTLLLAVKDEYACRFYEAEALRGGWTARQLARQINSQFYERTALSRNKLAMLRKGEKQRPGDQVTPEQEIRDPMVLEFLDLKDEYSESDLVIDIKLTEFTHADAGQMHMYLNYAREHWTVEGENPPVGLILCSSKNASIARYALDGLPNKVMAAEYRTALPSAELLTRHIEHTRAQLLARPKPGRGG